MTDTLCKLVFVCPKETADSIVEILLEVDFQLPAFTTFNAEGHGHNFDVASAHEQVRGRVDRRILWLVLPTSDKNRIVDEVAAQIKNPHDIYWVEPILEIGHLSS